MTKYLLYTSENCGACSLMKSALDTFGVQFSEIKLKNGMILPPDVRSTPTLAVEKDGRRTTICSCWPGSMKKLEDMLRERGISFKK